MVVDAIGGGGLSLRHSLQTPVIGAEQIREQLSALGFETVAGLAWTCDLTFDHVHLPENFGASGGVRSAQRCIPNHR